MANRKEHLILELKELFSIALYLAGCFSLLATAKSLILIQLGINDFVHGYIKALVESVALGKIVVLTQNISVLRTFGNNSLLRSSVFKSAVMTAIVFVGGGLEEKIFAKHVAEAPLRQEMMIMVAHLLALFIVFYALFLVRGLDTALGPGKLLKLLTEKRPDKLPVPVGEQPLA